MPPKHRLQSEASESAFFFVNQDATTLGQQKRNALLDSDKQSHVQRLTYKLRQRVKEQQSMEPSGSSREASQHPDSNNVDPGLLAGLDSFNPEDPFQEEEPFIATLNGLVLPANHAESVSSPAPRDFQPVESAMAQLPSSAVVLDRPHSLQEEVEGIHDSSTRQGMVQIDNNAPIRSPLRARTIHPMFSGQFQMLEKWAPPLIQYNNTTILPEKFWADTLRVPLGQMRHAPAIHADMRDIMAEPVHLYCFLASASAQMLSKEGRLLLPEVEVPDDQVPLFFTTRAIEAIRQSIMNGISSQRLVLDLHYLVANAYALNKFDAAKPHLNAMESMIEELGGINSFSDYFRELNLLLHWSAGLKRLSQPQALLDFDPGSGLSIHTAMPDDLTITKPDSSSIGATLLSLWPTLSTSLLNLALHHAEAARFHSWISTNPTYEPDHYKWLSLRRLAIGYRLLSMPPLVADPQEECFRIALIFWTGLTLCPTSGQRCASQEVHTLRARLVASHLGDLWDNDTSNPPHSYDSGAGSGDVGRYVLRTHLLFWTAVTGALASTSVSHIHWFADLAVGAGKRIGIDFANRDDVEGVLQGILYDSTAQRSQLMAFLTLVEMILPPPRGNLVE